MTDAINNSEREAASNPPINSSAAGDLFSAAEYSQRIASLRQGMAERELDALVLTSEADVRYVSGFLTRFWESPTRPWFIVVPATAKPIAVIPSIGSELMSRTWLGDIRTWVSPDLNDDGISLLAQTLQDIPAPFGKVGIPMGHETHLRMPLADFFWLQEKLPQTKFTDATKIIRSVREIKSESELAKIRQACAIADRTFAKVKDFTAAGDGLDEICRKFQITLLEEGSDWVPYLAAGAGLGGYSDVISPPTRSPLTGGDVMMIDVGAICGGYFCDFDRNFAIESASDATNRAYETLYAATEAGIQAARVGQTASSVFYAMSKVIVDAGYEQPQGRLGHGLGSQLTEWPSLIDCDHTLLREGMVLTIEPWLTIAPGKTMVHEENIVVSAHGASLLSRRASAEIPIIGN